jgi:signal peptidase I
MTAMKRRRPWFAFILSLVCPGLGQLYNGNVRWAAGALVLSAAVTYLSAVYLFDTFAKLMQALLLGLLVDIFFAIHAWFQAKQLGAVALKPFQRWWIYLGFAILLYGLPGGYGYFIPERFLSFQIPSESMVPTLLVGDRLVADGWAYRNGSPHRGDIIVFDYPRDPSIKYVKRVIGLPGDEVKIVGGELFVNRVLVKAHRTSEPSTVEDGWGVVAYVETLGSVKHEIHRAQPTMFLNYGPVTVPEKSYFVMGDNRDRSSDSRVWGFVPESAIVGQMKYIYFSWDGEKGGIRWDRVSEPVF